MLNSEKHISWFAFFVLFVPCVFAAFFLAGAFWLPWMSPNLAVKYLEINDGKSPFNTSREAALFWKGDFYESFRLKVGFDEFNNYTTAFTFVELMGNGVYPALDYGQEMNDAEGKYSKLVGCHILRHYETNLNECNAYFDLVVTSGTESQKRLLKKTLEMGLRL